jgi:hypothetical protein
MKKIFLTLFLSLVSFTLMMGQANKSGNININVGLGFSPTYFSEDQTLESTPIHFSADYSIFSFLSVGLGWSLAGGSESADFQNIPATLVSSYNTFSLRGNAHLPVFERLDIYAGGTVGVQRVVEVFREVNNGSALPDGLESNKFSIFQPSGHVGVRWRVLGNLGLYAESGYGLSLVQVGLNMKL